MTRPPDAPGHAMPPCLFLPAGDPCRQPPRRWSRRGTPGLLMNGQAIPGTAPAGFPL